MILLILFVFISLIKLNVTRYGLSMLFTPIIIYAIIYGFGFCVVPYLVDDNGYWNTIEDIVLTDVFMAFLGLLLGSIISLVKIQRHISVPAIIPNWAWMDTGFLKMTYFVTMILLLFQIYVRYETNTLVMGGAPIQGNYISQLLGYVVMLLGMSHTGIIFYTFLPILSVLILASAESKVYVYITFLIYLFLSIITTQKAILIYCLLTQLVVYDLFYKKIRARFYLFFIASIPFFLIISVILNFNRWATLNGFSYGFFDIFNYIELQDSFDYFLARFDFYKSATLAYMEPDLYPSNGILDIIKSFIFFIPSSLLFGVDIFPVRFARAYNVGGDLDVGITVPLVIDIALGLNRTLITPVFIIIGYILSSWYSFVRRDLTTFNISMLIFIPIIYITIGTLPLYELIYQFLRGGMFIFIYLFFIRIVNEFRLKFL